MRSPAQRILTLLAPIALAIGCAGAPFPAPIEGEPVCPDFELGLTRAKMNGSLRFPVRLQILDGKRVAMKLIIDGKRTASAQPAHTYIADDNAEYTAEWGQCENERAPVPTTEPTKKGHTPKVKEGGASYECGDAVVYKTEKFVTKKHDKDSHKLTFVAPPKPECWVSDVPAAADTGDAGAPDAAAAGPGEAASAAAGASASAAPLVAPPSASAAPLVAPPSASAAPAVAPKK